MQRVRAQDIMSTLQEYIADHAPLQQNNTTAELNNINKVWANAGPQFKSGKLKQLCIQNKIRLTLATPKHQEQNAYAKQSWQSIQLLAFAMMVHGQVSKVYTSLALYHA